MVNSTHLLSHYERLKSRFNLLICCTQRNVKKNLCQTDIIKNCRQLRSCKTRRHVELSQTCAALGEQTTLPKQIHTMTKTCWWYIDMNKLEIQVGPLYLSEFCLHHLKFLHICLEKSISTYFDNLELFQDIFRCKNCYEKCTIS